MDYMVKALRQATLYRARLNLSMDGEWVVEIHIIRTGKTESMKFGIAVP